MNYIGRYLETAEFYIDLSIRPCQRIWLLPADEVPRKESSSTPVKHALNSTLEMCYLELSLNT